MYQELAKKDPSIVRIIYHPNQVSFECYGRGGRGTYNYCGTISLNRLFQANQGVRQAYFTNVNWCGPPTKFNEHPWVKLMKRKLFDLYFIVIEIVRYVV